MEQLIKSFRLWLQRATFFRIMVIGFVIIILQIPVQMIDHLIYERQATKQGAIKDISSKWGGKQSIIGPKLVVPYIRTTTVENKLGKMREVKSKHYAIFLPDTFSAKSIVTNKTRYRGIFEVALYQADIVLSGKYSKPDFSKWGIEASAVLWDEAELVVEVADAHAIRKQVYLKWNQKSIPFEPGLGKTQKQGNGFHLPLKSLLDVEKYNYTINLFINGSEQLFVTPVGKDSSITISANWPDPSFQGKWLPSERPITKDRFKDRFDAHWDVPYISRNYPQSWLNDNFSDTVLAYSSVGVKFISPVDNYRMSIRSIKYAFVFLLLTFTSIWLIEIISKRRVHLIQYLFIGLGMSFFFLLLLSLSEHIGFGWAYMIASVSVISVVTAYSKAALKTSKRAAIIGFGITLLYGYLYTLLLEQNYSLLIGSVGVFMALTLVMFLTRNIDWYALGKPDGSEVEETK